MSKYRNKRSAASPEIWPELAGRRFDSKLERDRAQELVLLLRQGELSDLEFQPMYKLTDAMISYRSDFAYIEQGRAVTEEIKGMEGERWRIIKKLWRYYGPNILRVYKRSTGSSIKLTDTIMPVSGSHG